MSIWSGRYLRTSGVVQLGGVVTNHRTVRYEAAAEPVLTVRQPWAALIVDGVKTVENRS